MQTFGFKTAKLTGRVTIEVDRRWVRAAVNDKRTHIDFNLVDTIHYWVKQSRGAALTGHLVIRDRQGRKLALQCSSFGQERDFAEFLHAVAATLAAVGEARPDLRVAIEPTAFHRRLMAGVILVAVAVAGAASYILGADDDWVKVGGAIAGVMIAAGVVAFRYGPLRKKPEMATPADLARQIAVRAG